MQLEDKPVISKDLVNILLLALLTALMAFLYGHIEETRPEYADWDIWEYSRMAEAAPGLADDVPSPFAYRLLGPYFAGLLPFPEIQAFRLLSLLFSWVLVCCFYSLLRSQGLSATTAVVTVSLFTFNKHHFGFNLWDYYQVNDVLVLILLTVMLWALYGKRWWLLGIVFCLGAVTKETCLLMIPTALLYLYERDTLRSEWQSYLRSTIPGLIVFLTIRSIVIPAGGPGLAESFLAHSPKAFSLTAPIHLLINPFLPFVFLPLIHFKTTVLFFRSRKHLLLFVALVLLSSLFGANNERLMAPCSLVFYWLIGTILQESGGGKVLIGCCLVFGFLSSFHDEIGRWPLPDHSLAMGVSILSWVGVTGAGIMDVRFRWMKTVREHKTNT